jgi:hypothetical protein
MRPSQREQNTMTLPTPRTTVLMAVLAATMLAGCAPASLPEDLPAGRAALVVVGPEGATRQVCVALEGGEATGRQLLEGSGLPVLLDDRNAMGALVCSIDSLGCDYPAEPCFCRCEQLGDCTYWAYFVRTPPGDWTYSVQGVSAQPVGPGEVHAWIWLDASTTGTQAAGLLPEIEFDQVCP